jgi:hypothetical protein
VHKALEMGPADVAARPLDLCDSDWTSLWLQELEDEYRLGIINWADEAQDKVFSFQTYGLAVPGVATDLWTGKKYTVRQGKLIISLAPHASALVQWLLMPG